MISQKQADNCWGFNSQIHLFELINKCAVKKHGPEKDSEVIENWVLVGTNCVLFKNKNKEYMKHLTFLTIPQN